MISQKSQIRNLTGGGWFSWELKFLGLFLGLISFSNLIYSNNTFALFIPTLSASVDQANLQVNGNQVINSTNKTTEIPFNFTVNTNNRTGYTATLSAETENTALTNTGSVVGAKIDSISTNLSLNNLPNNTWGYKFGVSSNYAPIPALSTPAQILQTTGKTNGNDVNQLSIGMKLADNLESGNYTNKLILSFVSNPYQMRAMTTNGWYFNTRLHNLETTMNKIEHFKKSTTAPAISMDAVNIEDEDSDYEIKLWLNPTDKTAYYYAEPEKVYLNTDMRSMFSHMSSLTTLDLSNFDTSQVTDMGSMFEGMESLISLDLSSFRTENVRDMNSMFFGMTKLSNLNIENFDTRNVTGMNKMFCYTNLSNIDVSKFDTSKVTDMNYMFNNIKKLTELDLSNFDTREVTSMFAMFYNSTDLVSLDISNFNTEKVTNLSHMFSLGDDQVGLDKLEKIYVNNDFSTSKMDSFYDVFKNRKKLRGGNGSYLADPSTADKSWLRVDRPGVQGYFTRKS